MEWQDGGPSQDIEDRRGESGGGGGGLNPLGVLGLLGLLRAGPIGIVIFIVIVLIGLVGRSHFLGGGNPATTTLSSASSPVAGTAAEQRDVQLISYVLDDAQNTWSQIFEANNRQYRHAKLVLFRDSTYSGCGTAQAATGPFYCPADQKIYIDLGFWDELTQLGGSTSDFAKSYVITHELGHHIQNLLGIEAREQRLAQSSGDENPLSVDLELQADCFAGVWGHATTQRSKINANDISQALKSAAAVGDDHIQKMSGRAVSPESWTHGSSADREKWFRTGYDSGKVSSCATFNGRLAP
jgi:uncharacterized protein